MSADLFKEFGQSSGPQRETGTINANHNCDDDFGDFEEPENDFREEINLFRAEGHSQLNHNRNKQIAHSEPDWGDFEDGTILFDVEVEEAQSQHKALQRSQDSNKKASAALSLSHVVEDEDFDAWEPVASNASTPLAEAIPQTVADTLFFKNKAANVSQSSRVDSTGPPPTNIPPPSLLLSLSTSVVQNNFKHKRIVPDILQNQDIPQMLCHARAMSRILNGRKLRWKRDSFLSQSMRIGQAGKQGGMKLTSIDKTESRREDQEAAELQQAWKQQAGLLRAVVSAANANDSTGSTRVPEILANAPVRVAKTDEGAVTAPKACFLCGLRRDERVLRVDFEVEDSFGEWWVEHWGHVDCVGFWNQFKDLLPQK